MKYFTGRLSDKSQALTKGLSWLGRPKRVLLVLVEPGVAQVVRARRGRGGWTLDPVETHPARGEETVVEVLRRLGLGPEDKTPTGLVVLLSPGLHSMHREVYPLAVRETIDQTILFDMAENSFLDEERLAVFRGQLLEGEESLVVPLFSIPRPFLDELLDALGQERFKASCVIPLGVALGRLLPREEAQALVTGQAVLLRSLADRSVEAHRFIKGVLAESLVLRQGSPTLRLFLERAESCAGDPEGAMLRLGRPDQPHDSIEDLLGRQVRELQLPGGLLPAILRGYLEDGVLEGYGERIDVRPLKMPKSLVAGLAAAAVLLAWGLYLEQENASLKIEAQSLAAQLRGLDAKLDPILQLQRRTEALQALRAVRTEFNKSELSAVGLLSLLSEVTPEDTWYSSLQLKDSQITIQGESASAMRLITILSEVPGFDQVKVISPVRATSTGGKEVFSIQISLSLEKLKLEPGLARGPKLPQGPGEGPGEGPPQGQEGERPAPKRPRQGARS